MDILKQIKLNLQQNNLDEAIAKLNEVIADDDRCEEAYILRGNAYRRRNDWKHAIDDYCQAKELNPGGAGEQAYNAAMQILDFYNTDLYNP
ncbi:MAG: tetratricopeptide repeat protein [Muribaculaceae bacterium]|nr:tetratricopeptide repeat protein [Muribaculaceae bacterium]